MKKSSRAVWTAVTAAAAAGIFPTAAFAAVNTYDIPGGKVVIVGNGAGDDCGISLPDLSLPGITIPDISGPGIIIPGTGLPETVLPGPQPPSGEDVETDGEISAFAEEVARLVNEERAKAGLPLLTVDPGAAAAAQIRAKEIQTSFSHTRPDGRNFSTALTEAGARFAGAGENIAYGQATPRQVMDVWMNSSGHRANILNESYTSIGVGYERNSAGVAYWTQLFIR